MLASALANICTVGAWIVIDAGVMMIVLAPQISVMFATDVIVIGPVTLSVSVAPTVVDRAIPIDVVCAMPIVWVRFFATVLVWLPVAMVENSSPLISVVSREVPGHSCFADLARLDVMDGDIVVLLGVHAGSFRTPSCLRTCTRCTRCRPSRSPT